jgi:hypothetical protein
MVCYGIVSFLIGSIGIVNPNKVRRSIVLTVRIARVSLELANVGIRVLARCEPEAFLEHATR